MTQLALLRHTRTAWNIDGRLQGRTDIPALEESLAGLRKLAVPQPYAGWPWRSSPLLRTRQTAEALGLAAQPEPALIETSWGDYEGLTIAQLQAHYGEDFAANEARGLDLLPPNGESPRQVQARLLPWLAELAQTGVDTGAVTHKGVIRAIMALAYDWPMLGKPPVKLDWKALHVFRLDADGTPRPLLMNVTLVPR